MLRLNITSRSVVRWYLGVALTLTALSGILHWVVTPPTGLVRTFYADVGFAGEPLFQDRTTEVSLAFLDEDPTLPRRLFSVHWHGFWYLPHAQTVDLYAGADDRVDVLVDRRLVLRRNPVVGMHTTGETIRLAAGAHEIIVRYEQDRGGTGLNIQQAGEGGDPGPFLPTQLFPQRPDTQDYLLATGTSLVVRSTVVLWLVLAIGVLLVVTAWAAVRVSPYVARPGRRALHSWRTVQGVFERVTGRTIAQTCHIFSLAALAVAQPLFDVVSQEPAFFVARNTTAPGLAAMVAVVCFALPSVLVAIEFALARLSAAVSGVAHGVVLTMLWAGLLMPIMKRFEGVSAATAMGSALLVAGAVALAYRRFGAVRTFMTALSPAIVVVPAVFLMNPTVQEAVVRTDAMFGPATVTKAPPVVVVVFDEFPVSSLMDRDHGIDRVRYPHFARLADTAGWYRNASTVSSQTVWAVPAIATGTYPLERNAVPTRRYYPNNLFTMLSASYRMTVFGRFQQLCPANRCTYDLEVQDSLSGLVADLSVVYAHVIAPDSVAAQLPPILGDWRDFATARRFRNEGGERRLFDRTSELDRFIETITSEHEGQLYFLHTLTPHMPFEYVPSGHRYDAPDYQGHLEGGERLFLNSDPWLSRVLQQRHLLQVGFADRFVGKLLDRLTAQGIFDETLLIITADHGTSFQHGKPRRSSTEGTRAEVMLVPLIIKLPGQITGHVSDQNVETVDIVPTIASVLSTTVPYDVDGRSILDSTQPQRAHKTFIRRNYDRVVSLEEHPPNLEDRYVGLEERLRDFESGLYALGPHASLVGRSLSSVDVRTDNEILLHLENLARFDDVDLKGHTLPLYVRGTLADGLAERVSVAIAVNGSIVATTQSYLEQGVWIFSSMIPEEALTRGANEVKVFVVDGDGDESVLRLATESHP